MSFAEKNVALFLLGPGNALIGESPYPTITDEHDIIIRIAYVGVCGSDVSFWTKGGIGKKVDPSRPLIMGHEASGTVHEIGSAVSSLKAGDNVAIEPGLPCRRCLPCKGGRYNLCSQMLFAADPPFSHGTLRKYFKLAEDFCYKLPQFLSLEEGVLVEPLAVAVHVCRLAEIGLGQDVVVFGSGTIGLLCAAVSKSMGAQKIIAVDVNASRLEFSRQFADTGIYKPETNDTSEDIARKIKKIHDLGKGADTVLEATGVATCIGAGIHVLKKGGTFIQAGLGEPEIQFPITTLSEKEMTMKGSFRYGAGDYELALHLLESKKVPSLSQLISSVSAFENTTEAWERTRKGEGIKNLIRGPQG